MTILKQALPNIIIFTAILGLFVGLNYYLTRPINIYEFNQAMVDNDIEKAQRLIDRPINRLTI